MSPLIVCPNLYLPTEAHYLRCRPSHNSQSGQFRRAAALFFCNVLSDAMKQACNLQASVLVCQGVHPKAGRHLWASRFRVGLLGGTYLSLG